MTKAFDFDPTGARAAVGRAGVAAANPQAARAGLNVLAAGGSAVDAAVAVQAMLTLVEPNASGIGGGALIVVHDGGGFAYDGLSAAPASAPESMTAEVGPATVGVPGALRALEMAHAAHGRLPWSALFADAIAAAEDGFPLSPYPHRMARDMPAMQAEPLAAAQFWPQGRLLPAGSIRRNAALAATLRRIAAGGADAFYLGETAAAILAVVPQMAAADLAGYRAVARPPLRFALGDHSVIGGPLPAYGALAAGQIIGIAAARGLTSLGPAPDVETIHILASAGLLARADRAPVQDPAAGTVDAQALLDPAYLADRARHLGERLPADEETGASMTSHVCIADAQGQVVSMTTTINQNFGARLSAGGFFLNNVMTNFAARGGGVNAMRPGLRARTTIGPCIVLDPAGKPIAALGAGGGYRIIGYVANALLRLAGGLRDPAAILAAPHALRWSAATEIEPPLARHAAALEARGHDVLVRRMDGGTQCLTIDGGLVRAAGDLRRDGAGFALP